MTILSRALTFLAALLALSPLAANAQNQTPAHLTYNGDATAKNQARAKLSATVNDDFNKPVDGGNLTFKLGSQSCSAVTDKTGKGVCTLLVNQPAGKYKIEVEFGGTGLFAGASSTTAAFVIAK